MAGPVPCPVAKITGTERNIRLKLQVRELSEAAFQSMAAEWQECLAESDANPLFMSWPWLFSWWEIWSQLLGLELLLIAVFTPDGKLAGIAPFYYRNIIMPAGLYVRRIHFLGNAWRIGPTVRTEYCSFILHREYHEAARQAIMEHLWEKDWDEVILCDVVEQESCRVAGVFKEYSDSIVRIDRLKDMGVRIDTGGDFSRWLADLGRNTRLKAYNRRAYLEGKGKLYIKNTDAAESRDEFFRLLNGFHSKRWHHYAFEEEAMRFHEKLLDRLPAYGFRSILSSLWFEDQCISVLYDVASADWRFNLQAGYLEHFDPKVSLGSLHLGFAIEEAFSDSRIRYYDLLAGSGKKSFYKSHYNGTLINFDTVQFVRNDWLVFAYQKQLGLPASWRRAINRAFRL